MKRQASYGELYELGNRFDQLLLDRGITLCDEEYKSEAFMDFVSQYEDGNDEPTLNLLYPTRQIQVGSVVKFKNIFPDITFKVFGVVRPGEILGSGETNQSDELMYRMQVDKESKGWIGVEIMFGRASELEVA